MLITFRFFILPIILKKRILTNKQQKRIIIKFQLKNQLYLAF